MTHHKVYEDPAKKDDNHTKTLYKLFPLTTTHRGGIKLVAVDDKGEPRMAGHILSINPSGTLTLFSSISKDLGLSLKTDRKITVES